MKYSQKMQAFYGAPWAILPETLQQIGEILRTKDDSCVICGLSRFEQVAVARQEVRAQSSARSGGAIAVLPLLGPIFQRANMLTEFLGWTNLQRFAGSFRAAMADPQVSTIVLDVDSPGGEAFGTPEMADEIFAARGRKRIMAVANSLMASAAYWIASAADEVVVTPSGQAGSIGVLALHREFSEQEKSLGVKSTLISAGKYKTEGNQVEPLGEDARAAIQAKVDEYYGLFVRAVARNRGASMKDVRENYGQGRVVLATEAKQSGLADRVATLDETLERLGAARTAGIRAELERERLSIEALS